MTMAETIDELVRANAILHEQGVVDGFGHVSVRHPDQRDHFLLSRSKAPANVSYYDILVHGPDGEPLNLSDGRPYAERFIHSAIYCARPDVTAIVHSHSPSVIPFSCVPSVPLRPVFHMASFLGSQVPCFEIREQAGDGSDLLVRDSRLGAALAETLGDATVVLMRGHGSTTVGRTLREAVFRAVYAEVNAKVQMAAHGLGPTVFLTEAESDAATESNSQHLDRAWDLWAADLD